MEGFRMSFAKSIKSLLPGTSAERSRLEGDISDFERRLDYLRIVGPGSWVDSADKSLKAARKALDDYDFSLSWKCLHEAQNMSLRRLTAIVDIRDEAQIILNEARDKLGESWRKKSIEYLLTEKGDLKANISSNELVRADEILTEYLENRYHKIGVFTRHLSLLSIFAVMAIIIFIAILVLLEFLFGIKGLGVFTWNMALSIVIFGVMGAVVSGMLSARDRTEARIPDQRISNSMTLAKLAVGAMSALAVVAFVNSGFLRVPVEYSAKPELILAVSFAAGFTERLVHRAVDTVAQSDSKK